MILRIILLWIVAAAVGGPAMADDRAAYRDAERALNNLKALESPPPKPYRPMPQEYYEREEAGRRSLMREPTYTNCYTVGNQVQCVTR